MAEVLWSDNATYRFIDVIEIKFIIIENQTKYERLLIILIILRQLGTRKPDEHMKDLKFLFRTTFKIMPQ